MPLTSETSDFLKGIVKKATEIKVQLDKVQSAGITKEDLKNLTMALNLADPKERE